MNTRNARNLLSIMALPPPPPGVGLQDTQVPRILGVNIATFTLAVAAISLRFTARRLTHLPFWWDDWLMLPAIVCLTQYFNFLVNGGVDSRGHRDGCVYHLQ